MSKQDITFTPTSPRHTAALWIRETLRCLNLDDAYGIQMERMFDSKGKNHWSITFCRAGTVDGHVRVYSDRYILITIEQRKGAQRFTSYRDAQEWLIRQFV